jgi:TRAP-type C4-dicarboxylate transport system substrate-binding protein
MRRPHLRLPFTRARDRRNVERAREALRLRASGCRTLAAGALLLGVAGCAGSHAAAHRASSAHYADQEGDAVDGGVDIRGVDVSSTKSGRISFRVKLDKLDPKGTIVDLWLDTDANPETGNATFTDAGGAEYLFTAFLGTKADCGTFSAAIPGGNGCFAVWAPKGSWESAAARTARISRSTTGFTASIDRSDLGNTRDLNFHVDRADKDRAPGSGTYNYSLALGGPKPEASPAGNQPANKAGAPEKHGPTVLTLATHDYADPFVDAYLAALKRIAGNSIKIDVKYGWRYYDLAAEQATISDVRHGDFDLASVGARAWDLVGVKSVRAVVAPFLVDSAALQERVLEGRLAQRMLDGLRPAGLVGLALLPGELRRPLGVTRALTRPQDFRGDRIGIRTGGVAKRTFAALGATARPFPSLPNGLARLDGAEVGLPTIMNNRYDLRARALTSNVVLWPRATTIFMSRKAFDALSSDQQDALRRAGREAVAPLAALYEGYERDSLAALCRARRLRLVAVSAADRAALRRAVQPVYDELERDAVTRDVIEGIESLRASLPLAPTLACGRSSQPAARSPLDGDWRVALSSHELRPVTATPSEIEQYRGAWTLHIRSRHWVARNLDNGDVYTGTLTVNGRNVQAVVASCTPSTRCDPGSLSQHRWSRYRDKLTFARLPGRYAIPILVAKPWSREH